MSRWWTGTARDTEPLAVQSKRRFAVYADTEEEAKARVLEYGYDLTTIELNPTYKPIGSGEYSFRCVPESKEIPL